MNVTILGMIIRTDNLINNNTCLHSSASIPPGVTWLYFYFENAAATSVISFILQNQVINKEHIFTKRWPIIQNQR